MGGLFTDILGTQGLGLTGEQKSGSQRTDVDPTSQALNEFRASQIQSLFTQPTPNFSSLVNQAGNTGTLDPITTALLGLGVNSSQQPGLDPSQWFNNATNAVNPTGEQNRLQGLTNTANSQVQGNTDTNISQVLNTLLPILTGAGNSFFNEIMAPQISNQNSLMGLGRSGSTEESMAKGRASIASPIAQLIASLISSIGQQNTSLQNTNTSQGYAGQQSTGSNYLQSLFGLNQAYPGIDINARNATLQRLLQGFQASDFPRQAQAQALQNQSNTFLTGINATPYNPGSQTNQQGTIDKGIVDSAFGGGGGGSAVAGLAAAGAFSDKKLKDNIELYNTYELLDSLTTYSFTYKNTNHGKGAQIGIMAQDLEKTTLGSDLIIEKPEGKFIDAYKSIGTIFACLADLHKRIKELEHGSTIKCE